MRRFTAGDPGVEPGGVRLRAAGAEHSVPARGRRGLRRHPGAGGPPRPTDAAGGPGEALSATSEGLSPSRLYLYLLFHSSDTLRGQTAHREIWLTQEVRGGCGQSAQQEEIEHRERPRCGSRVPFSSVTEFKSLLVKRVGTYTLNT